MGGHSHNAGQTRPQFPTVGSETAPKNERNEFQKPGTDCPHILCPQLLEMLGGEEAG